MNQNSKTQFIIVIFLMLCTNLNLYSQNDPVKKGSLKSENNSQVISYDLPDKLAPGKDYTATVTVLNNGKSKWTKADNYYLGIYNEPDSNNSSGVWGISRVDLSKDVPPAGKVIFLFNIVAPKIPGMYKMQWAMAKDKNFFGEYTDNTVNVTSDSARGTADAEGNNSEIVSLRIAGTMTAGEKYKVSLTLKNTGNRTWHASEYSDYKISPYTEPSDVIYSDWNSSSYYLSNSIEPGQTSDVEFYVVAPSNPGIYGLQWIMKGGSGYFGQKTERVAINVVRNSASQNDSREFNASFIEQNVPNSMTENELSEVSITMRNTGSKTWIQGNEHLVFVDTKMSLITINLWNAGYIQLPNNVDPGGTVTFKFKVKPDETGWQYFQCSMMKEDGTLFGSPTKSVEVIVTKK